jgi:hypothetical protein
MRSCPLTAFLVLSFANLACTKSPHKEPQAKSQAKPPLPESVSPGWTLASLTQSAAPPEVSAVGSPDCWRANYTGPGATQVWLCRYKDKNGAFDAAQSARTQPQILKFQEGEYFVVVEWSDVSISDLTALVRTVQENLKGK